MAAEPLRDAHGTPGFRGTPVEKHCPKSKVMEQNQEVFQYQIKYFAVLSDSFVNKNILQALFLIKSVPLFKKYVILNKILFKYPSCQIPPW